MLPWFVYLFVGVLDFGFCAYAAIATQNAARIAATWGAANPTNAGHISSNACSYAAPAFTYAPVHVTACGTNLSVSTSAPTVGSGASQMPTVKVAVTYNVTLIALPGLLPGSIAITRAVEMPVR
jgi:hypothetical protein